MCEWGTYKTVHLCRPKDISKRTEIPVDACLADLVQALNNFDIETVTCCCGHNKGDGEIILADGRHLIIRHDSLNLKEIPPRIPVAVHFFFCADCPDEKIKEWVRMPNGDIVVRTEQGESFWFDKEGKHPKSEIIFE